jgi:hypothetical protein
MKSKEDSSRSKYEVANAATSRAVTAPRNSYYFRVLFQGLMNNLKRTQTTRIRD